MNKIKCKFNHHWRWRLHNINLLNKMCFNCGQFRTVLVRETVWVNDSNQWVCSLHNPSWSSRWIPQHPSSSCLYCWAACFKRLQRWVRYCCTERPQRGSTAQVCWCRTKYTTEQGSREKPSVKLRPTQESAVVFLVVSWAVGLIVSVHLSLLNYRVSSPHLLLSSFSSSYFLSLALSLSLCGSPAFAFFDCESVCPFHTHHYCPLSCCPPLSLWFWQFSCFYVDL